MDNHITDRTTFGARKRPTAVVRPMGFAEAGYAMAYAKDLFKRLKGYAAARDPGAKWGRKAGTTADHALVYARDLFKRLRVHPANDRPDPGHRGARFGRVARTEADHAMAYAKDLFKRLKSFPAAAGASGKRPYPIANAISRAMARLARLIRRSVVEPYARRRRRKIAIAQLRALDDRLLADIGLARGDIVPTVDGMLARRDDMVSRPVEPAPPAKERRRELPLAA